MRESFPSVQGEACAHAPTAALLTAPAGAPNPKCPVFSAPSRICRSESGFTSHKPPQGHIRTSPFPNRAVRCERLWTMSHWCLILALHARQGLVGRRAWNPIDGIRFQRRQNAVGTGQAVPFLGCPPSPFLLSLSPLPPSPRNASGRLGQGREAIGDLILDMPYDLLKRKDLTSPKQRFSTYLGQQWLLPRQRHGSP